MNTNVRKSDRSTDRADEACVVTCFDGELVSALRARLPEPAALEESSRLFAALSDPTRLKMLITLEDGRELCVCDLAHVAGTTISTASHHLRKLRDLGVLKHRNDGRMVYYAIRSRRAAQLASVMFAEIAP